MYNAFDAIKDTVLMTAEFVSNDLKKIRLEVCTGCPNFRRLTRTCSECGCQLDLKVLYARSQCPKQKW